MSQRKFVTDWREKIKKLYSNLRKISFSNLSDSQLEGLANIFADAGQVFLAALIVPFFLALDEPNWSMLLSGVTVILACWLMALFIRRSL